MKGTIALDLDGTLTDHSHELFPEVIEYLKSLVEGGWRLIFVTGRTYKSGYRTLKVLPFNYFLAVQNGAIILEMPSQVIVAKRYLDRSIFQGMDDVCRGEPSDFVIYGGYEHQDHCYFRPKRFSSDLLNYLKERLSGFNETWQAVDSFEEMELDEFPSVKCFGQYPSASQLARKIEDRLGLHVPLIRDPFNANYYVVQATHAQINKGQALQDLISLTGERGKLIAAGDDYNDLPMLALADVKIVMATAPKELMQIADIVAPPASEQGIIRGLEAAVQK